MLDFGGPVAEVGVGRALGCGGGGPLLVGVGWVGVGPGRAVFRPGRAGG